MLHLQTYLIKEHVGMFKLVDAYDIFDPAGGDQVGVAKEEPSGFMKFLRLFMSKRALPTKVVVYEKGGDRAFSIERGFTLLRSKVFVRDRDHKVIGFFKSKLLSLGGGFWVYDADGKQFAEVRGDWKGWNFKFLTSDGQELGTVAKKWAGLAKELFTSADNYVIALNDDVDEREGGNMLLLAAGLAIDIIYKEH
ncbi:MAG: oxidoreductase [Planctomycetes bacterium]|nr:oxidoreductase [Planctomycetota bacterium]